MRQKLRELVVDGKGSTPWPAIPERGTRQKARRKARAFISSSLEFQLSTSINCDTLQCLTARQELYDMHDKQQAVRHSASEREGGPASRSRLRTTAVASSTTQLSAQISANAGFEARLGLGAYGTLPCADIRQLSGSITRKQVQRMRRRPGNRLARCRPPPPPPGPDMSEAEVCELIECGFQPRRCCMLGVRQGTWTQGCLCQVINAS
ncbi:hypothetical protein OH77DRAFT_1209732 [Trametes cingulata]|nr:hypothetical protein OH77DRAFT_1209732 [Trametes cingulata]